MEPTTNLTEAVDKPRSRRALLAGVLGGLGAWLLSAAERTTPAMAGAGDPILAGRTTTAGTASTELRTGTTKPAFRAVQVGAGAALRGDATSGRGVMGTADSGGTGVYAFSPDGYGVWASTVSGYAIYAKTGHLKGPATAIRAYTDGPESISVEAIALGGPQSYAVVATGPSVFEGMSANQVTVNNWLSLLNVGAQPDPLPNAASLFLRATTDDKLELAIQFPTGPAQVLATSE